MRLMVAVFAFMVAGFAAAPALPQEDPVCKQALINLE
jgi:hypothetical protein